MDSGRARSDLSDREIGKRASDSVVVIDEIGKRDRTNESGGADLAGSSGKSRL